ncbi:MAG: ATP-dependent DNA helicase RecG [Bacilli bacterium]|nr:ATP-dependent DNA helicase RecG [Bacilli bacterium]
MLNKLGIYNIYDLITFYPFRYNLIKRSDLNSLMDKDRIVMDGYIENTPTLFRFKSKLDQMRFKLNTGSNLMNVTIYNRGFLKNKLNIGTYVTVIGKYDKIHNSIVASELRFGSILKDTIEPVYHTTYGLSNNQLEQYIKELLENNIEIKDYIPSFLKEKYLFNDKLIDIKNIHNPKNLNDLKKSIRRLKYEELFIFMLKMNNLKTNKEIKKGLKRVVDYNLVNEFINKLPFTLTPDQDKTVKDIYDDLVSEKRMNRLVQGDVGSGKTIVAIISMYINYLSGYQSALMAPTEILAEQHYNNIKNIFKNYNINVCLLTGKIKAKEKLEILKKIKSGEYDFIIGTHSLQSDDVEYNNLGLVITDEQHRFGVNQRSSLKNKGTTPDVLYLSATPIPRTYALTLYGDMDVSSIKTNPGGKKDIITTLKKESDMKDVLNSIYKELKQGHQAYIIAPLIEESDKSDLKNIYELEENMNKAFGKLYNIGILHGKMTDIEKEEVMNKFKNNEIQILISTTVIEVGIDVKNATMMVIFDSFRFGLSTLHQLRGRVGRNTIQSYCILISNKETERLNVLTKTTDGFKISEEDFRLRGSGDLFGLRQSGDMKFKIANLKNDYKILLMAKEDSENFIKNNDVTPYLDELNITS